MKATRLTVRPDGVFRFYGPLHAEIRFGNGAFVSGLAQSLTGRHFLGIERSLRYLQWLLACLHASQTENALVIQADASFIFDRLIGLGDVARMFVNSLDPKPKDRHYNCRLIPPAFVDLVSRQLSPGGELIIGTDHVDNAE